MGGRHVRTGRTVLSAICAVRVWERFYGHAIGGRRLEYFHLWHRLGVAHMASCVICVYAQVPRTRPDIERRSNLTLILHSHNTAITMRPDAGRLRSDLIVEYFHSEPYKSHTRPHERADK